MVYARASIQANLRTRQGCICGCDCLYTPCTRHFRHTSLRTRGHSLALLAPLEPESENPRRSTIHHLQKITFINDQSTVEFINLRSSSTLLLKSRKLADHENKSNVKLLSGSKMISPSCCFLATLYVDKHAFGLFALCNRMVAGDLSPKSQTEIIHQTKLRFSNVWDKLFSIEKSYDKKVAIYDSYICKMYMHTKKNQWNLLVLIYQTTAWIKNFQSSPNLDFTCTCICSLLVCMLKHISLFCPSGLLYTILLVLHLNYVVVSATEMDEKKLAEVIQRSKTD